MLCLYLQAPFAAFRHFSAGSFRSTAGFITYSAAYGLLLNVAGVEMRAEDKAKQMTVIKEELPHFSIALGAIELPAQHTIFQQLHNYPVGKSGSEHKDHTKGSKYNIAPARRAFLSGIRGYICISGNSEMEAAITDGLEGRTPRDYGLPFLGDNSFLIDRLEIAETPSELFWYVRVNENDLEQMKEDILRLTISVDRTDMSKTDSALFMPKHYEGGVIPEEAWVEVGY